MKKCLSAFFAFFLFVGISSADILVRSESGAQKYPAGSTLNIDAVKNISVEYQNTVIFIPEGQKLSIRCAQANEDNRIFITGSDFKIKIGAETVTVKGSSSFTIDSITGKLYVEKGDIEVADKDGNVGFYSQGSSYQLKLDSNVVKDGFLPISLQKKSQYEQAEQDVILSPSAPR
jgi:hypothetical protein